MKQRLILSAVAATLAIAVFAVAAPRGPESKRGGGHHGAVGQLLNPKVIEELDLGSEEVEKLQEMRYEAKKQHVRLRADAKLARLEVHHLLQKDNPDESTVMKAIEQAGKAKTELRKSEVSQMLKTRSLLGSEKWSKFKEMRQTRLRHMAERRHRQRGRWGREEGRGSDRRHGGPHRGRNRSEGPHGESGNRPDDGE